MKVTSGSAGGIHIDYPSSSRPTTDKVRQAIFSALGSRIDFEGKSALDMFAGSGAMGIEALSRGAKTAVFIDTNKDACKIIQKNLEKAKLDTYGIILNIDFQKFQSDTQFDIIFLDPPYDKNLLEPALKMIIDKNLTHSNSLIICENNVEITYSPELEVVFNKKYGTIHIAILTPKS